MPKLTNKQVRFCQEYVTDFNASRSALAAGYAAKTAGSIGSENLKKPEIQAEIQRLMQGATKKLEITREKVIEQYGKLAFFDIRTIYREDNTLKDVSEFDDAAAAAVAGIKINELSFGQGGAKIKIGEAVEIKVRDSRAALDSLCKVNGWNAAELSEVKQTVTVNVDPATVAAVIAALKNTL